MIRFWAIISNTIREGLAKKTIITLVVLITIIMGFFLIALSLGNDVLFLFGRRLRGLPEEILRGMEAGTTAFFYQVSLFIGIFAVASFYPSMQEKGTIDLLLSRSMSRFSIYTAKFIGCILVVFVVISYTVLGTWFVFWLKTGVAHIEYLTTIPIFMMMFLAVMAFIALAGVVLRNTTLSAILGIFIPFLFSAIFYGLHESQLLEGSALWYELFEGLYWALPKIPELTAWNLEIIAEGFGNFEPFINIDTCIWTTLMFAAVCYVLGAIVFQRRSY